MNLSQIWWWFMTFEINQWYQWQPRNWNMRGDIFPLLTTLQVLYEVWALGTYEYLHSFPVVFEKICLRAYCFKMFHVCAHKSFHIINFTEIMSKFSDYISKSFLRKGISWIVGDLTISCLHDTRVQFSEFVWVFDLRVTPKIVLKTREC